MGHHSCAVGSQHTNLVVPTQLSHVGVMSHRN